MKPLFTEEQYKNTKYTNSLPLECAVCHKTFKVIKHSIYKAKKYALRYPNEKSKQRITCDYCSIDCRNKSKITSVGVQCKNCGKYFIKTKGDYKRSLNHFCSHSCAAIYNNLHKTTGTRRSKLEVWIEEQLHNVYSLITILPNDKTAIGAELDIYIPSLKLAFEINGIYHYEPIHGMKKFNKVQIRDHLKFTLCHKNNIELYVLDSSCMTCFKPKNAQKYLDVICNTINAKMGG